MSFETYTVYPRVYYFQQRVDDLYERFKRVIGQFSDVYQDNIWLADIQMCIEKMRRPLDFNIKCREDLNFGVKDVILKKVDEKTNSTSTSDKDPLQIHVFYDKLYDFTKETKTNTVQRMKLFMEDITREDLSNLDTCFAFVDIPSQVPAEDIEQFRAFVTNLLSEGFREDRLGDRVVVGPETVSLSTKISSVLEALVMAVFERMYGYLDRFLQQYPKFVSHEFKITEVDGLEKTVSDFVNFLLPLMEFRIHLSDRTFEEIAIERFANQIKMLIIRSIVQEYNIKGSVCRSLLEEVEFEEKVITSIKKSENCKKHLCTLDQQTLKQYYEELIYMLEEKKDAIKTSNRNKYMIKDFLECLEGPLEETGKAIVEKVKVLNVMQKMKFEISGYYKQSIVADITQERNPAQLTGLLIKAIKSLNEDHYDGPIYGCGVIYGILQILVLDLNREIRDKIATVLKRHQFWYPYKVTLVKQKPVDLSTVETGDQVLAIWRKDTRKKGTLGGIAINSNGDKYALTCAHVVSISDKPAKYVYVDKNNRKQFLGPGCMDTMIMNGETDIAAIKVEKDIGNIQEQFKDEYGNPKLPVLFSESPFNAIAKFPFVYKFGAMTGLTKGMLASPEVHFFANIRLGIKFFLLIERQPDVDPDQAKFAAEGDSGAIVCTRDINDADRVVILAMIRSGEMVSAGNDENQVLTFMLMHGLQSLSEQTNHTLNLKFQ